jgi:hypothetical protein
MTSESIARSGGVARYVQAHRASGLRGRAAHAAAEEVLRREWPAADDDAIARVAELGRRMLVVLSRRARRGRKNWTDRDYLTM